MQEPIQDRRGDDVVGKDLAPLFKGFVGGNDDGPLLVAFGDELEEEFGRLLCKREIPEFVDDEEIDTLAQLRGRSVLWDAASAVGAAKGKRSSI